MRDHYEYVAIIEFDDSAGLRQYLEHPTHDVLSRHFYASTETMLAYDYHLLEGTEGIGDLLAGSG
jgi:hypothetical protein